MIVRFDINNVYDYAIYTDIEEAKKNLLKDYLAWNIYNPKTDKAKRKLLNKLIADFYFVKINFLKDYLSKKNLLTDEKQEELLAEILFIWKRGGHIEGNSGLM